MIVMIGTIHAHCLQSASSLFISQDNLTYPLSHLHCTPWAKHPTKTNRMPIRGSLPSIPGAALLPSGTGEKKEVLATNSIATVE